MPEQSTNAKPTRLQLDLRIPVALIISLAVGFLAQTAAMYRWVGGIEQRVVQLEESDARSAAQRDLLARLDERVNSLVGSMSRIERHLDSLLSDRVQR